MQLAQTTEMTKDNILWGYLFQMKFGENGQYMAQFWDKDIKGRIVDTDYETFFIAQTCDKKGMGLYEENLYVYSRDPEQKVEIPENLGEQNLYNVK